MSVSGGKVMVFDASSWSLTHTCHVGNARLVSKVERDEFWGDFCDHFRENLCCFCVFFAFFFYFLKIELKLKCYFFKVLLTAVLITELFLKHAGQGHMKSLTVCVCVCERRTESTTIFAQSSAAGHVISPPQW